MQRRTRSSSRHRTVAAFSLATLAVLLLSLGGYVGYVLYPRFDLPGVTVAGLFVLAAGAGIASFFSPCSFPLLISLFGRSPSQERSGTRPSWNHTLPFALHLSTGAIVFLLIVGAVIALAGAQVFEGIVFTSTEGIILRSTVGAILILLGLIQFGVIRVPVPPVQDHVGPLVGSMRSQKNRASGARVALFGFGYLVAGFGWTGPILAGLAAYALVIGGPAAAIGAFFTAGLVILSLMTGLAMIVTLAREQTIRSLRLATANARRFGGVVLIGVGLWFLALAIWADFFATVFPV